MKLQFQQEETIVPSVWKLWFQVIETLVSNLDLANNNI